MKLLATSLLTFGAAIALDAATTIDNTNKYAYGANIGWINWQGDVTNGAVIGEFICSGSIYSANCGWINLGGGAPANGIRYQNNSGTDFGVNVQDYFANGAICEAKLRGFAYGANIGWINFENTGNPRVNLANGQLLGFAYSANTGWISLSGAGINLFTTSIFPGVDTDSDGIPDAWERQFAGNLTTLTATGDRDGDGELDKEEYLADTNPFDVNDSLRITAFNLVPSMSNLTWTSKPSRKYRIESNPDLLSPWIIRADDVPSAGTTTSAAFAEGAATQRFFKVSALRPLTP
jgi:hypothetical protein